MRNHIQTPVQSGVEVNQYDQQQIPHEDNKK